MGCLGFIRGAEGGGGLNLFLVPLVFTLVVPLLLVRNLLTIQREMALGCFFLLAYDLSIIAIVNEEMKIVRRPHEKLLMPERRCSRKSSTSD